MKRVSLSSLTEFQKHSIAYSLRHALEEDFPDFVEEAKLPTSNGFPQMRWNFINRRLMECPSNYQILKLKRGPWEFLIFYDKSTNKTYSLMREITFRMHKSKIQPFHYLNILCARNEDVQTALFNDDSVLKKQNEFREILLAGINDFVKGHELILFEYEADCLLSIRRVLLSRNLDILEEEDLKTFSKPSSAEDINTISRSSDEVDMDEYVSLKPKYKKSNDNIESNVMIKNIDNSNNKEA